MGFSSHPLWSTTFYPMQLSIDELGTTMFQWNKSNWLIQSSVDILKLCTSSTLNVCNIVQNSVLGNSMRANKTFCSLFETHKADVVSILSKTNLARRLWHKGRLLHGDFCSWKEVRQFVPTALPILVIALSCVLYPIFFGVWHIFSVGYYSQA